MGIKNVLQTHENALSITFDAYMGSCTLDMIAACRPGNTIASARIALASVSGIRKPGPITAEACISAGTLASTCAWVSAVCCCPARRVIRSSSEGGAAAPCAAALLAKPVVV